jgi:hypothetical protein
MATLVKFTNGRQHTWINPAHVIAVLPGPAGFAKIVVGPGMAYDVNGDQDSVTAALADVRKIAPKPEETP